MKWFRRASSQPEIDRRLLHRARVDCQARLVRSSGDLYGCLRDLSEGGAQLRLDVPLAEGAAGILQWHGFEADCRVVWSQGDICGLVFEKPVARSVVEETLHLSPRDAGPAADLDKIPLAPKGARRALVMPDESGT